MMESDKKYQIVMRCKEWPEDRTVTINSQNGDIARQWAEIQLKAWKITNKVKIIVTQILIEKQPEPVIQKDKGKSKTKRIKNSIPVL